MEQEFCEISRWDLLKKQLNNLDGKAFQQAIEEWKDATLIDVRRPGEFAIDALPNAINMDYLGEGFYDQLDQLDPKARYLVYCRSGRRSLRTCVLMQNSGFENIYNLDGGLKMMNNIL